MNQFLGERSELPARPSRPLFFQRRFAIAVVVAGIVLPSLAFAFLLHAPRELKPRLFVAMLCGPLGDLRGISKVSDWIVVFGLIVLLIAYPLFPRSITFGMTLLGLLLWLFCGFVAATGGM
jgi:hypothetical protein